MTCLRLAYAFNLLVLLPIAVPTPPAAVPHQSGEIRGERRLAGAGGPLRTVILVLSALGLYAPLRYSLVLVLQVIYKTLWLLVFALPRVVNGRTHSIPWGITGSFIIIVLVWPFIIPWGYLFSGQ